MMWTTAKLPDGTDTEYGLGWDVAKDRGLDITAHGGQVAGFVANFTRYMDEEVAIIVFLNRYRVSSRYAKEIVLDYIMPDTVGK
jgi:hypothetical protein